MRVSLWYNDRPYAILRARARPYGNNVMIENYKCAFWTARKMSTVINVFSNTTRYVCAHGYACVKSEEKCFRCNQIKTGAERAEQAEHTHSSPPTVVWRLSLVTSNIFETFTFSLCTYIDLFKTFSRCANIIVILYILLWTPAIHTSHCCAHNCFLLSKICSLYPICTRSRWFFYSKLFSITTFCNRCGLK